MSYMHFHCWLLFPLQLKKRESRCIHEYTVPSMTEYGRADPKMFTCTCKCFNAFSLFRFYHPFEKKAWTGKTGMFFISSESIKLHVKRKLALFLFLLFCLFILSALLAKWTICGLSVSEVLSKDCMGSFFYYAIVKWGFFSDKLVSKLISTVTIKVSVNLLTHF